MDPTRAARLQRLGRALRRRRWLSRAGVERVASSLWFLPLVVISSSIAIGYALSTVGYAQGDGLPYPLFHSSASGARAVLALVAGTTMSVASLTFSITVVAVQAAANAAPRVASLFLRDIGVRTVLSVFLGTFAYSYVVLTTVAEADDATPAHVPGIAINVLSLYVIACVGLLVYFFSHMVRTLTVEHILDKILCDSLAVVAVTTFTIEPGTDASDARELAGDGSTFERPLPHVPACAVRILASRSGYFRGADLRELGRMGAQQRLVIRFRPIPGDHITCGSLLAWVWPANSTTGAYVELHDHADATLLGERTCEPYLALLSGIVNELADVASSRSAGGQDLGDGIRQMTDVAVRALSPGVNDPSTAVLALDRLSSLMATLIRREVDHLVAFDRAGYLRTIVRMPTVDMYLGLFCNPIRYYGRRDVAVTRRLLFLLAEVGEAAGQHAERHRSLIRRNIELIRKSSEEAFGASSLEYASVNEAAAYSSNLVAVAGSTQAVSSGSLGDSHTVAVFEDTMEDAKQ